MNTRERIAFDGRYISDDYHGIGRYAFRLLEAMIEICLHSTPWWRFIIYTGKGKDTRFDWQRLRVRPNVEIRSGPWPLYWPHEQILWPWLLKQDSIDLFFSPYFTAPLLVKIPTIVSVHDLIFDRYPQYMPQRWAYPYYRLMMRWSTQRSKKVLAVSQATAVDLQATYAVPSDKIAILPEGVEPDFKPVEDHQTLKAIKKRYGLQDRFVLSVGTRRPHKNLDRLVRAFARIDPSLAPQLVFAGPADSRCPDQARQTAEQLNLDGRVRFLGWVPEADLSGLYSSATIVVFPSLIEGFGLPALEAMACGTPLIASSTSALPEIIGEAGLLVDPLDLDAWATAISEVLSNKDKREEMKAAGQERAKQFTWQKTARAALDLVTQTLL